MYCNRGEGFSGDRECSDNSIREGGRLFIHFAKVTSANIVFEIVPHSHPVEVLGGVFEAFLCSHVCHLLVGNPDNFVPDVVSCVGCFIGNIWTVSTVILPSFKKKSINNDPAGVVGILADDIKERIRGGSFPETVIPFAFEVLGKLEGANIECS